MIKFLRFLADTIENKKHYFCNHNYKLVDDCSNDALGVHYGYKLYKCSKCNHIDKQFWHN